MTPKRIAVLGSTGSIGRQTIDVVRQLPDRFAIAALAAGRNTARLAEQVAELHPRYVYAAARDAALDDAIAAAGASWLPMEEMAVADDVDIVLAGTGGAAGLLPTIAALEAGKPVAIANKEALVMAGHLIRRAMVAGGGGIRPVDSEHSAIWQCLWGEEEHGIRRIMLTASGGAFRDLDPGALAAVTPAQALKHPTWNMGDKITVDCATLMNKGMETIEAMWLFDVPMEAVQVVLHRESIVHSLVEFSDGSVKAQLGVPDMRLPIQCALAYPERMPEPPAPPSTSPWRASSPSASRTSRASPACGSRWRRDASAGTFPAAMAAADEVAVERFMAGEAGFLDIPAIIEGVMERHESTPDPDLEAVFAADRWAREAAGAAPAGAGA